MQNEENVQKEEFEVQTDMEMIEIDLNSLSEEIENASDEEAMDIIKKKIPKFSNAQVRRYLNLMSRHKPGKEKEKAAKKAASRAKSKVARKSRKQNRK